MACELYEHPLSRERLSPAASVRHILEENNNGTPVPACDVPRGGPNTQPGNEYTSYVQI